MNTIYQYHVCNDHLDMIVSIPVENEAHAIRLARSVAVDFHNCPQENAEEEVTCVFVCEFTMDSVINLRELDHVSIKDAT